MLFASTNIGFAQAPAESGSPLDLARGLRENQLADLALEYLDQLVKSPALSAEDKILLPLERAKARLDIAKRDPDEASRDTAVNLAKSEFEAFIKGNPSHPRLPEARLALARVTFLQGRTYLTRAFTLEKEERKAELARARPFFRDAAKAYEEAAAKLEELTKGESLSASVKRELIRDTFEARLDQGICGFNIGETYYEPRDKEVGERFKAYKDARDFFTRLGEVDDKNPVCWVAKAWAIECSYTLPEPPEAEKGATAFREAMKKQDFGNTASMEGARMFQFFELRRKWRGVSLSSPLTDFQATTKMCNDWLRIYRTSNWTPEHYAVTYFHGTLRYDEARVRNSDKEGKPLKTMPREAINLLNEAQKDFRTLTETENEYTEKAARERQRAIRMLVGDVAKPPKQYTNFEELHMAAMVQIYRANEAKEADEKKKLFQIAVPLLEHERTMNIPRESMREASNGQLILILLYMELGRPQHAAIMAEHMAKTARNSTIIAKAGYNAVLAYLASSRQLLPTDTANKRVDEARAAAMARFLEQTVPEDPVTDAARFQLAILLNQQQRTVELFDVLHRISKRFSFAANARLMQGAAAFEMLRFRRPEEKPLIPPERKAEVFRTALTDINAILPPPASATEQEAATYIRLQVQLAQLYLTSGSDGYAQAAKAATDAKALIATYPALKEEKNEALAMEIGIRAELVRIDAVYGLARMDSEAGKFKEAADRMAPLLALTAQEKSVAEKVSASKNDAIKNDQTLLSLAKRLDEFRLDRVIGEALNARVREGELVKAGELFTLLEQLGGDITRSSTAIYRLVNASKPQIEALRADKKNEEANKLATGVATLVSQLASKPDLKPSMNYNLGKAFIDLGDYPKAIDMLSKIAKPEDPGYYGNPNSQDPKEIAKRQDAIVYRASLQELVRAYTLAKDFTKAEALLESALGRAGEKPAPNTPNKNWGVRFVEIRRERINFLEEKAGSVKGKDAIGLWVEAMKAWGELVKEYEYAIKTWNPRPPTEVQLGSMAAGGIMVFIGPEKENNARVIATVLKPRYYEVNFQYVRCQTMAYLQAYAGRPEAELASKLGGIAARMKSYESSFTDMADDIVMMYRGLLDEVPLLKAEYTKLGGGKFLAPSTKLPGTP